MSCSPRTKEKASESVCSEECQQNGDASKQDSQNGSEGDIASSVPQSEEASESAYLPEGELVSPEDEAQIPQVEAHTTDDYSHTPEPKESSEPAYRSAVVKTDNSTFGDICRFKMTVFKIRAANRGLKVVQ